MGRAFDRAALEAELACGRIVVDRRMRVVFLRREHLPRRAEWTGEGGAVVLGWSVERGSHVCAQPETLRKSGARRSAKARKASAASAVFSRAPKISPSRAICAAITCASRINFFVACSAPVGLLARAFAAAS